MLRAYKDFVISPPKLHTKTRLKHLSAAGDSLSRVPQPNASFSDFDITFLPT